MRIALLFLLIWIHSRHSTCLSQSTDRRWAFINDSTVAVPTIDLIKGGAKILTLEEKKAEYRDIGISRGKEITELRDALVLSKRESKGKDELNQRLRSELARMDAQAKEDAADILRLKGWAVFGKLTLYVGVPLIVAGVIMTAAR